MIVLPAIDMKDGRCVRLRKGDFDTVHQVAAGALETARRFADAGAKWVHMVDLDGARDGVRKNFPQIFEVITQSGLQVELGGGIKSVPDLITVVEAGAARAVVGSAAVTHPEVVDYAIAQWGADRVAVGIDCLNGKVRTAGWEADSGLDFLDFARQMEERGVRTLIFTDIAADGMLSGPSYGQLAALQEAVGCQIVASGGVTTLDDVKRLRDMGLYGAIIGKAYYAGTLDLAEAVKEAGAQC
ncbi:MAG TPA: 1-(5-phosphoribosyl)-5-[(5-phosphoribosylamino)methylideneamino]imidazole-4-carboxamide isomerase [Candidatus Intestinimonas pullistercoris]|uniref:1-(5-phosphoribosyl)-5-[(5-phosphoribosylamino)methylideneamino] imidazole-4-carboxamide isomerase n=1 Tax=Candidatus Intestinimonas pullistercoris TaxID=2838623 RepID=A0A9D2P1T6_9FIRM|nr:1-(5-phosphoribosyl)-5-[(5-phosphoribosylamino)methylideneamino]imidazole-4-carboxamide isomerase [uncultured Intestinimonas sp.]HJC41109.1 1-(5-phosphoribosyl)-5-[(5-phosphoribosylamino)methylideneamino]imidazole-4-carboxamide isomerase [Candidatus Intestinimonas pullistercoris]